MPTLRYIGPIDEVDVVGVGTFSREDRELEVSDEVAAALLGQVDNFEVVGGGAAALDGLKVPQLKVYAEAHGIDLGDATKKADIIAAIEKG